MNDDSPSPGLPAQDLRLAKYRLRVNVRLEKWREERVAERIVAKDASLWPGDDPDTIRDRLGWLDLPGEGYLLTPQIEDFVREIRLQGFRRVFLAGMGGSSLAPEVFEKTFGDPEKPFVVVADSTHPDSVRRWIDQIDSDSYFFIVSSKSGSTLETRTLFFAFWHAMERWHSQPGLKFAAITDPRSDLETAANHRGFSHVFSTPADVGGRFSALSAFGLVPAALSGANIDRLIATSRDMLGACGSAESPGVELGAALAELALAGRDKLTIYASPSIDSFPNWLEQLIAESLGKDGKGIVPIVDELPGDVERYGSDRVFVGLLVDGEDNAVEENLRRLEEAGHPVIVCRLRNAYDLGAEIVRWEVAVAAAAIALEVQPFDQPDVESSKVFTRSALAGEATDLPEVTPIVEGADRDALKSALEGWKESVKAGDYVSIQAFLPPGEELERSMRSFQAAVRDRTGCAVSWGYGPRYLHSTGQLHKGGQNAGVFLQLLDRPGSDLLVPEQEYSFATVVAAQADGDAAALEQAGRRLLRIRLNGKPAAVILRLRDLILA